MLASLLVGLDGSTFSQSALSLAIRWAKACGARVCGAAVVDEPGIIAVQSLPISGAGVSPDVNAKLLDDARGKAERLLAEFTDRCGREGVTAESLILTGDPPDVLSQELQRHDLIMLGVETFFRYEYQDSPCNTLDYVLHQPPRPVVAVPEQLNDGTGPVVIGYDGGLQATRTLGAYVDSGLGREADHLVITIDEDEDEAGRIANNAVEFLTTHGLNARARPIETRIDPGPILLEHTRHLNARLLVMGAFGHSMLREYVLGSTTRTVLRGSSVPVMLYH